MAGHELRGHINRRVEVAVSPLAIERQAVTDNCYLRNMTEFLRRENHMGLSRVLNISLQFLDLLPYIIFHAFIAFHMSESYRNLHRVYSFLGVHRHPARSSHLWVASPGVQLWLSLILKHLSGSSPVNRRIARGKGDREIFGNKLLPP